MLSHHCLRNKPQNGRALLYNRKGSIFATGVTALPKKDSYEEEYGRHSSFRPKSRSGSGGLPVVKILAVVFALAFAGLGYDRWRGQPPGVSPAATWPPGASQQTPPPEVPQEVPSARAAAEEPASASVIVEMPSIPVQPRTVAEKAPPPDQDDEPAALMAEYVMEKDLHSNSFVGMGSINGKDVALLADTGASVVVVPEKIARQIGLKQGTEMSFNTGGGSVSHYATKLDSLTLGDIELRNVDAAINPAMQQDVVLLGMSALGIMQMQYEQGRLVLKYKMPRVSHDLAVEEPFKRSSKDCVRHGNKFDQQTLDCLKGK